MRLGDRDRGLYAKYRVTKTDFTSVDPNADYVVLRVDNDIHAQEAVEAYAQSVKESNPALAEDMLAKVALHRRRKTGVDQFDLGGVRG